MDTNKIRDIALVAVVTLLIGLVIGVTFLPAGLSWLRESALPAAVETSNGRRESERELLADIRDRLKSIGEDTRFLQGFAAKRGSVGDAPGK